MPFDNQEAPVVTKRYPTYDELEREVRALFDTKVPSTGLLIVFAKRILDEPSIDTERAELLTMARDHHRAKNGVPVDGDACCAGCKDLHVAYHCGNAAITDASGKIVAYTDHHGVKHVL